MSAARRAQRTARRLYRLCQVNGALDERRARRVVTRLAGTRARGSLATLSAFHRLLTLDRHQHTALVESAVPLEAALRTELERQLHRRYGAGLVTSFTENPALLGGVRIRVASDVYDGSIRARLAALQARW